MTTMTQKSVTEYIKIIDKQFTYFDLRQSLMKIHTHVKTSI